MASRSSEDEPQAKGYLPMKRNIHEMNIQKARGKVDSYKNYKGRMVPPKSVPDEIMCKCPGKCSISIGDEPTNLAMEKLSSCLLMVFRPQRLQGCS
ncbi:hypothetical protein AVEN_235525-1 [Araneus ventricosus]|uniref:Uncharacterized protein n=1 Tax=Araneus ventricosus TaxID=182803 RepID=A0A4Y2A5I6_ARAVE|nr:hypothetical protein AVEN_235525-1 [Araneus ventricosus]